MGPSFVQCFEDMEVSISSSRHCLAALALSKITFSGRDSEVEPEVEVEPLVISEKRQGHWEI